MAAADADAKTNRKEVGHCPTFSFEEAGMFVSMSLKKINRILRWTGMRLTVSLDDAFLANPRGNKSPNTRIGLSWYGWGFIKNLDKDLV